MSEDQVATQPDHDDEEAIAPVAHDDIMKRLLDYQRQLREGAHEGASSIVADAALEAPAATATDELVDLTSAGSLSEDATADVVDLSAASEDDVVDLPESDATTVIEPAVATIERGAIDGERDAADDGPDAVDDASDVIAPTDDALQTVSANGSTHDMVTATEAAPVQDVATATGDADLSARLERLERTLDRLTDQLADVRQSFQDLAIAADEKIASLEDEIAEARRTLR